MGGGGWGSKLSYIRAQSQKLQNDSPTTIKHGGVPSIHMSRIFSKQKCSIYPYSRYYPIFDFFNLLENQRFRLDSPGPLPREIIINQQPSQHFGPHYMHFYLSK